jgi:hypothetical protein
MTGQRRVIGTILVLLLAVAIGAALFVSVRNQVNVHSVTAVSGVVGSEKGPFFSDPAVLAELHKNQLDVKVTTQGSREMALGATKTGADFYFPAGEPAARELAKRLGLTSMSTPFLTPMIVASWEPIVKILSANGMVHHSSARWSTLDMSALLAAMSSEKRWSDLKGSSAFATGKSVLISSTDVRKSNSADMYLALASYVYNGNDIVSTPEQVSRVLPKVRGLFLRQGFQESSSAGPFDDYVTIGMGKAPLVMAYEQQFIEYLGQHASSDRPAAMVLLYPEPTIYTKHTIVPTDAAGQRLADLLQNDSRLRELEIEHGFRNGDSAAMRAYWKSHDINVPETLIDVIDPPSFETLETMIVDIEKAYAAQ